MSALDSACSYNFTGVLLKGLARGRTLHSVVMQDFTGLTVYQQLELVIARLVGVAKEASETDRFRPWASEASQKLWWSQSDWSFWITLMAALVFELVLILMLFTRTLRNPNDTFWNSVSSVAYMIAGGMGLGWTLLGQAASEVVFANANVAAIALVSVPLYAIAIGLLGVSYALFDESGERRTWLTYRMRVWILDLQYAIMALLVFVGARYAPVGTTAKLQGIAGVVLFALSYTGTVAFVVEDVLERQLTFDASSDPNSQGAQDFKAFVETAAEEAGEPAPAQNGERLAYAVRQTRWKVRLSARLVRALLALVASVLMVIIVDQTLTFGYFFVNEQHDAFFGPVVVAAIFALTEIAALIIMLVVASCAEARERELEARRVRPKPSSGSRKKTKTLKEKESKRSKTSTNALEVQDTRGIGMRVDEELDLSADDEDDDASSNEDEHERILLGAVSDEFVGH